MTDTLTAELAFERYRDFYEHDALIQGSWHGLGDDGRELACGLGALDPAINSPRDCPSAVMPRWLAQMVPSFFDNQKPEDAYPWGLAFYAELKRLSGNVPFSVVHDWQANIVGPLAIETAHKQKRDNGVHTALAVMQGKALAGEKFTADEWRPVLKAAFLDIYKWRYRANADAYADAYAYAYAYADAYADAYAYADADAYANANADAYADADAYAYAYADADADAYRSRIKRLADGMVECLRRVK